MGGSDRHRAMSADRIFLRQPVLHPNRRSFCRGHDVGHARHSGNDAATHPVMVGDHRGWPFDWVGDRYPDRRHHYPCLSARGVAVVRRGSLRRARPRNLALSLPDRRALRCHHRHRLDDGVCALAVAADRQSVPPVQKGARALCDHPHDVRIFPLGRAHLDQRIAGVLHPGSASGPAAGDFSSPAGGGLDWRHCGWHRSCAIPPRSGAAIPAQVCELRDW